MLAALRRLAQPALASEILALKRGAAAAAAALAAAEAEAARAAGVAAAVADALATTKARADDAVLFLQNLVGALVLQQHRESIAVSSDMFDAAAACRRVVVTETGAGNLIVGFRDPDPDGDDPDTGVDID